MRRERQQLMHRKRSCWCSHWTACSHSYAADLLRATPRPDTSSADTNDTQRDETTATRGGERERACLCFYSGASLNIYLFLGQSRTTNTSDVVRLRVTAAASAVRLRPIRRRQINGNEATALKRLEQEVNKRKKVLVWLDVSRGDFGTEKSGEKR